MSHQHKCMSCGQSWDCPHPPSDCKAGESVFPTVVLRGPNGPQVFDHVCQRKPAARPEEKPSVAIGLLDALKDQKQCDPDGIECQVSRQAVDEAIAILERVAKGGRWCTISYAHMPHDTCDGTAAPSPQNT